MRFNPRRHSRGALAMAALSFLSTAGVCVAADWPTWGGTPSRNMVAPQSGPMPSAATPGEPKENSEEIDLATTKNIKWVAKLGSQTYGNPVVAGGRVYVGTNNTSPRDPKIEHDYGILLCFEEATGKMLWQLAVPKLAAGKNVDWEECGICSSPAVDGDRVYVITNRCEVVCLDARGMSNGNDGPFKDEGQYMAGPGHESIEPGAQDADILWRYDMRTEFGIFPHYMTSSAPLVVGDRVYATTSNSVDWTDKHTPSPDAPALICLDKNTGKLIGQERSGISSRTLYSNWSSPAFGDIGGKPTLVFGGGDGFCYGYDPEPQADGTLKELWRVDANPPEYREKDGEKIKYRDSEGPSEIISTPVIHEGRIYVAIGQDPEQGEGNGALSCIEVKYADGKATASAVWRFTKIHRSMCTASVIDGLVYCGDVTGFIYCIDAKTGQELWHHDAESHLWGSTLVADGKVYIGNESGELIILAHGREHKEIAKIDFGSAILSTPVPANGVLFVATGTNLYAVQEAKK